MNELRRATIEEDEARFFAYINIPYPYNRPESEWAEAEEEKILCLADPHEPYGNKMVYKECHDLHKDASTLIVPGDLGDYYSKSRFRKNREQLFSDELRACFLLMEWMATHWKNVFIMLGNHDNRPEKKIQDVFEGNTDLLILTEVNLLKRLASYFDNVRVVGHDIPNAGINLTHIYQHGDIVFTHGEVSRTKKEATLEYVSNKVRLWSKAWGLKPYSVIAQAHNHHAMKTIWGPEAWFMLPCATNAYSIGMEYIFNAKMIGSPPDIGYTIFYQNGGITDVNRSNNFLISYC